MPFDNWNCREIFRCLDDYLDRELTLDEMPGIRHHVWPVLRLKQCSPRSPTAQGTR